MKRRSLLAATSWAMAASPSRAQLRSPAQWLERDGTPRISTAAFGASGQLRVWLVAMPMPLWREWWNLLPVPAEAPRLVEGLIHHYLPGDEISLSLLVAGARRDDSRRRKLVARLTAFAPDGTAHPPTTQNHFWEGMPFDRSRTVGVLEPVLGVTDHIGRSAGTWTYRVDLMDTLASVQVSVSQDAAVGG